MAFFLCRERCSGTRRPLLAHWGRGYGTELARAMLRYGLTTLGRPRIHAFSLPQNRASCAILRKIGMIPDGTIVHGGLLHDLFVSPSLDRDPV